MISGSSDSRILSSRRSSPSSLPLSCWSMTREGYGGDAWEEELGVCIRVLGEIIFDLWISLINGLPQTSHNENIVLAKYLQAVRPRALSPISH